MLLTTFPRPRRAGRAIALAVAALAAAPAAAQADSIVLLKDANVFLAKGDGTGLHQVTTDGTVGSPWRSPSQADDGTIAAARGDEVVLLRQNGEVVRRLDPPALVDSVSHAVDGAPVDVAISPDGARIAYAFARSSCPVGADCAARQTTGFMTATGAPLPGNLYNRGNASWVTSTRSLVSGGYGGHVNLHDAGAPAEVHWFDDADVWGQGDATDFGDAEVTRDGRRLAGVRGYGDATHLMWFDVSGDPRTGAPPAAPAPLCATNQEPGIASPTWAPDGSALAWQSAEGIWIKRDPGTCAAPQPVNAIPGGSEPHWGPADVNPQPRPQPQQPGRPSPGGPAPQPSKPTAPGTKPQPGTTTKPGPGGGAGGGAPKVTIASAKLGALTGRGLTVGVPCAAACTVTVELVADARTAKALKLKGARRAGRATAKLGAAGTARVSVKVAAKHRARLRRLRKAAFTAVVRVETAGGGATVTTRHAVTVRR